MHSTTLAKDLSGGQRRRLAIALECLRPAPIMFLDEPTTGQDSTSALSIVKLLQELARGDEVIKPKTVVMVIHQVSLAQPSVTTYIQPNSNLFMRIFSAEDRNIRFG